MSSSGIVRIVIGKDVQLLAEFVFDFIDGGVDLGDFLWVVLHEDVNSDSDGYRNDERPNARPDKCK
jgi:hypothetical protein